MQPRQWPIFEFCYLSIFSLVFEKGKTNKVYFLGNANEKTKSIINSSNAIFVEDKLPSSIQIGKLASLKFISKHFENTANFEPFYLKEFIGNKLKSN